MGLGTAISGGIMLMAFLVIITIIIQDIVNTSGIINNASSERSRLESDIARTSISIHSITATELEDDFTLIINNTGMTKLWNYQKFNIIVTYDAVVTVANLTVVKAKKTESLAYTENAILNVGQWRVSQFLNDLVEPRIINPAESAEIACRLTSPLYTDARISVIISTDNGVITSRSVQVA